MNTDPAFTGLVLAELAEIPADDARKVPDQREGDAGSTALDLPIVADNADHVALRRLLDDAVRTLDQLPRLPVAERKAVRLQLRARLAAAGSPAGDQHEVAEDADRRLAGELERLRASVAEDAARRFAGELERLRAAVAVALDEAGLDPDMVLDPVPVDEWPVTAAITLFTMQAARIDKLERPHHLGTHACTYAAPVVEPFGPDVGHRLPVMAAVDLDDCCAPLDIALAHAFTERELAELAHGLADIPNLIRGAGGLAVRPLTTPGGPLARLAAAAAYANGHTPAPATTRGVVPIHR